jgi:hypothetical protein
VGPSFLTVEPVAAKATFSHGPCGSGVLTTPVLKFLCDILLLLHLIPSPTCTHTRHPMDMASLSF